MIWLAPLENYVMLLVNNQTLDRKYSYVSNNRACAFILFETFMQPCTVLFEPARLLIVEVTILPACLSKPEPFWIHLLDIGIFLGSLFIYLILEYFLNPLYFSTWALSPLNFMNKCLFINFNLGKKFLTHFHNFFSKGLTYSSL